MAFWKCERVVYVETCEPPYCSVIRLWDAEAPAVERVFQVACVEQVCPRHASAVTPSGNVIRSFDGNWRNKDEWLKQQTSWVLWYRAMRWLQEVVDGKRSDRDQVPSDIVSIVTRATVGVALIADLDLQLVAQQTEPPPARKIAVGNPNNLTRAWDVIEMEYQRKDIVKSTVAETLGIEPLAVRLHLEGLGADRIIVVDEPLSSSQGQQLEAAMDIQYGPGRVRMAV